LLSESRQPVIGNPLGQPQSKQPYLYSHTDRKNSISIHDMSWVSSDGASQKNIPMSSYSTRHSEMQ
jgi:hypothetical protein